MILHQVGAAIHALPDAAPESSSLDGVRLIAGTRGVSTVPGVTTTHATRRPPFLNAVLNPAPTPGVLLSDPLALQALRLPAGTVRALGTDVHAWRSHYSAAYAVLNVPPDWLSFWIAMADVDEVPALHRLQRLLAVLRSDPTTQGLTAAEVVSALTQALLVHHSTAALFRPSVRQAFIDGAH